MFNLEELSIAPHAARDAAICPCVVHAHSRRDRLTDLEQGLALSPQVWENRQAELPALVLNCDKRHVLSGLALHLRHVRDQPGDAREAAAGELVDSCLRKATHRLRDRQRSQRKTKDLLLHLAPLEIRRLLNNRHGLKQRQLSSASLALHLLKQNDAAAEGIQRAGLDQRLEMALVDLGAELCTQGCDIGVRAALRDELGEALPYAFNRKDSDAQRPVVDDAEVRL